MTRGENYSRFRLSLEYFSEKNITRMQNPSIESYSIPSTDMALFWNMKILPEDHFKIELLEYQEQWFFQFTCFAKHIGISVLHWSNPTS